MTSCADERPVGTASSNGQACIEFIHLDEIDSTNLHAKRLIQSGAFGREAAAGVCPLLIAQTQTAGVGRFGRAWASPRGGLWATWVLPPRVMDEAKTNIEQAGLVTGMACLKTVRASLERSGAGEESTGRVRLKWPNDIVINGKKICGVLCERVADSTTRNAAWLLIGVGINADFERAALPEELRETGTTLREVCRPAAPSIQPQWLAEALVNQLRERIIERGLDAPTLTEARSSLHGLGSEVLAFLPDGREVRGRLEGLDDRGLAQLRTSENLITLSAVTGMRTIGEPAPASRH